ncbi:glycoside hydrolase family 5 protein [Mariniflexile aquimaris]|uniref:Glycoside hydrolase family 5 protein n=1 Tax=Mariniflexile aquimaris TaxID=881009 RepID=A0ABW3BW10_9FLAO
MRNLKTVRLLIITLSVALLSGCKIPQPPTNNNTKSQVDVPATTNPMIHTKGTLIVDGNNNPIKLRGVLLEGWLMWNGTLWGAGLTSETKIANRLEKMAGKEQTETFRTAIYNNFITEKDIELIANFGFNVVRVPFNHTIFEDANPLENYKARGWYYLDNLLKWCEKHKVYVILDFHSVPGGQGAFVSDPDLINVWFSATNQQQTIDIWKAIAKRYANKNIIAGYDLINEPDAPTGKALVDFHRRIITEIRKVDSSHMIILEGGNFSSDFTMYTEALDSNMAYGFHTYNFFTNDTNLSNLQKLTKLAKSQNIPLLNGEFGAHNATWIKEEIELFEDPQNQVNGWIFWPWKRVSENNERYRHLAEISKNEDWKKVTEGIAALFGPSKDITPEIATRAMAKFIESSKAENLILDQEISVILKKYLKNN